MSRYERHVFVCTNRRAPGSPKGCCGSKDADAVLERFKAELAERGLLRRLRANASGCLNHCAGGVTVVVYPEAVWYGGVGPADVQEIVEGHLVGGEPVERLRVT